MIRRRRPTTEADRIKYLRIVLVVVGLICCDLDPGHVLMPNPALKRTCAKSRAARLALRYAARRSPQRHWGAGLSQVVLQAWAVLGSGPCRGQCLASREGAKGGILTLYRPSPGGHPHEHCYQTR